MSGYPTCFRRIDITISKPLPSKKTDEGSGAEKTGGDQDPGLLLKANAPGWPPVSQMSPDEAEAPTPQKVILSAAGGPQRESKPGPGSKPRNISQDMMSPDASVVIMKMSCNTIVPLELVQLGPPDGEMWKSNSLGDMTVDVPRDRGVATVKLPSNEQSGGHDSAPMKLVN